ncbi:Protein SAAL1 [Trachymyrmex zeteki]|uniref:Protein SAAL1 n=1 Tax=Mycetomoellerius zeteki TaxID=64791 RepID=A0A151X9P8_9HYME|nr:Protein SAAL1 [Trachymyrmex zeteki]
MLKVHRTSEMIDSQDVSKEELEVLKGDAVGNNLCSSKWIINTLMSLLKVDENGWTEELEDQLCTLWDLSMEGEVVSYLLSQDFFQIAKYLLTISDEPRFTEIVLGIIGNVCCNDEAIDTVGCDQELITQILSHLESSDSLILIQLIRILQLIVWKIRQNPQSNWVAHLTECEFFGATITFILKSSTNDDLLISTMSLLESISQISLLEKLFKINDLIPALLESFAQVIPEGKTSLSELTFVQHWMAVLIAVMESSLLTFEDYENDERFLKLMNIIYRMLKPYNKSYNLYPIQQQGANIIYDAMRVLLSFRRCNVNIPTRIDRIITILIFSLKTGIASLFFTLRRVESDQKRSVVFPVLQQIFMDCDASVSSMPDLTVLIDDAMPISRIVEYIQDQLPNWSIDNLEELWKCLAAVSTNDCVNLQQFKEATKCWITKMQHVQSAEHSNNNNVQEKLYLVNDAHSSMKTMDLTNDIVKLEFRNMKFRKLCEENNVLRDELERHERSINNLKQQHSITEKQLKHYVHKCQQFEKENDEQRDQLNELIKNEKTMTLALQRYTKEHQNLLKQLEAAEIEIQAIPPLKEKLEKITKEKMECLKLIAKMQEEFDEKENNYRQLKTTITELEDTSISMKEDYEYTIHNLREKNRKLVDENVELQSLSVLNACSTEERLSLSPVSGEDECYLHSTPYKSIKVTMEDSLYTELKASGFTSDYSRNNIQELEEELNEYDAKIVTILEQLEKVIQFFVTIRGSVDDLSRFNLQDTDAKAYNIDILRHKVSLLLNMMTEEITRRNTRQDLSTQLQVEPANTTSSLEQFGVRSFRDLLLTHATNRSIHTLPSHLQSLQLSSLAVEDSRQTFGYQNPETNTIDASFARGDGLTQEDHDEKSVLFTAEARDVSKEHPVHPEENLSSEMSKVSGVLKVDSKALTTSEEIKWDCTSEQVLEVSSASNPVSPRRKISVYCRPFDVMAVQDPREDHQGPNLEVRQSSSTPHNSPSQINKITDWERNIMVNCAFNHGYRNKESDSDSMNSTPEKQFQYSLLDDDPPVKQTLLRKIHLAPTRLKFPLEAQNELHRITEASNCTSPVSVNSTELDFSPIVGHKKDDDVSMHSSSKFIDKSSISFSPTDSAKIVDLKDPHSLTCVQRVDGESQSRIERSVDSQMSNREDSLAVSGNGEYKPAAGSSDRCSIAEEVANEVDKVVNVAPSASLTDSDSIKVVPCKNAVQSDEKARERNLLETKREIPQSETSRTSAAKNPDNKVDREFLPYKLLCGDFHSGSANAFIEFLLLFFHCLFRNITLLLQLALNMKRSYSEGENLDRLECRCKKNAALIPESSQQVEVFPRLTDIRLQESGIVNLSDTELAIRENSNELELQKKYTAFSLCLCIERLTLPRRTAMSLRQRDQSEKNLSYEVRKMQQDIQASEYENILELAPLCTDRESVERVERVRHQLDMIVRCAHRVSCVAETLGAVQQERRVSRAVLLADKYLHVLYSRCEKLITNVAETKRILVENNIVIEENASEFNDELPRIRYRSGTPANNRMMDTVRQRNSVSGRMTLRRPSFSSESPKWDIEKLDRAESSNSISELRGIFEQAESRRSSREENNNMLRLNHSNGQSTINCTIIDNEIWTNVKEEVSSEVSDNESINSESKSSAKSSQSFLLRRKRRVLSIWHIVLLSILIFFFVFYMIHAMSLNVCQEPLNKRLIGFVFDKCGQIRNAAPPM